MNTSNVYSEIRSIIARIFKCRILFSISLICALFLFMGGIQLLCLSIIGSYLAHIYDEVKRRPPYIVEKEHIDRIVNVVADAIRKHA